MSSPRRLDPALILLIAMLAALPALAWLQYSWIGEVEKADADRMRATLQRSADQLAAEVDSELGRFYRGVLAPARGGPPGPGGAPAPADPCEAFARWQATASQSRLIRGLYLRDPGNAVLACSAETGEFHAGQLPADMQSLATLWQQGPGSGPPSVRWETLPLVMMAPIRPPHDNPNEPRHGPPPKGGQREGEGAPGHGPGPPSFAIAVPDLVWMGGEWLPELVRRYFGDAASGEAGASDAIVRIENTSTHTRVYDSGAWGGGAADVSAQLLRVPGAFRGFDQQGPPQGYWTLLVRRREGSVAAVAARVRNRNLAVGGGVLTLMAIALAILLITLRRQKRLTQQQMEFVAGVSHELRTPVAVLSSAGENLADGIVTAPASVREYGAMIRDESRRLAGMIEQTLRFAGIQSGGARYKLQPVDIPQIVDAALRNCDALIRESGCTVELHLDAGLPPAAADPSALVHCIGNLLSNAARYAASGKSITVRARLESDGNAAAPDKPARLFIDVEDLGPGIDSRDVPHLFEPFYRGRHTRERQIQGTGLGLALVKSIMDGLGGSVEVRTAKGQGSQFRLILPVAAAGARPA
ncbi:MAG: ATP-binding protein [Bryobacteraceae bacterium]|nr:ATP-binding protein [Bryobacteraceae bacterium]